MLQGCGVRNGARLGCCPGYLETGVLFGVPLGARVGCKMGSSEGPVLGPAAARLGYRLGPRRGPFGARFGVHAGVLFEGKATFSLGQQGAFPLEAWATTEGKARGKTSISKPNHGKCPFWPENRPNPRFLCQMTENAHFCMKIDEIHGFWAKPRKTLIFA